ncbi:MAG: helix-hairpin-helix domain-containing protein, partial [Candidatus Bathyarchaeota archaeon]|nr:helix-hairpin-helix domain-containing protein [Candidatus Bathyarchaeota archaeon]
MPSAEEFKALMGFPKEGNTVGRLKVESVSVKRISVSHRKPPQYGFSAEIVVEGEGSEREVRVAFHRLSAGRKQIFSDNGTPYLCDAKKTVVHKANGKLSITSKWICVAQPRKAKLAGVRKNSRVTNMLREIAELYRLKEEPFKSRA